MRDGFQIADEAAMLNQPAEISRRPQTSHGRGRKNQGRPAAGDGIYRREEKTQGLGETSKDLFSIEDDDEDASTKQILMEKQAE